MRKAILLVKSIVILHSTGTASATGQVVLAVKHPEDVDPVARMRAAVGGYLAAQRRSGAAGEYVRVTWGEALRRLSAGDWADYGLRCPA